MTIASILAAEQAAFQQLQVTSGASAGAMACYWTTTPNDGAQNFAGDKFDQYTAPRALVFAMQGFLCNDQDVPPWLLNMVEAYIGWIMPRLMWSQQIATTGGSDATGYTYVAGDLLTYLRDGTVFALQHTFFTSPMNHAGTPNNYDLVGTGKGSYDQAKANAQAVFVKGSPYAFYASTTPGNPVWPGFSTERGDFSFTVPINQLGAYGGIAYVTASQTGTVVTVTLPGSRQVDVGSQFIFSSSAVATVTSFGTGTGGTGTYNVDVNQTVASGQAKLYSYLSQQADAVDGQFYDANDSAGGCLVTLIGLWLRQKSGADVKAWLTATVNGTSNWTALCACMASAVVNMDPNTGLPIAALWTQATYTQDTIEVLQGVRAMCEIIRTALAYDEGFFRTYTDGSSYYFEDQLDVWTAMMSQLQAALQKYCFNRPSVGYPNVPVGQGWNTVGNVQLDPPAPTVQSYLEPYISAWQDEVAYGSAYGFSRANVDDFYFRAIAAMNNGNGVPTTSAWIPDIPPPAGPIGPKIGVNVPNVYFYLSAAAALGAHNAPLTLTQLTTLVYAVSTANLASTPNRSYAIWWAFESAALMWLCQTLLTKGAT